MRMNVKRNDNVVTYISKMNVYGNRKTIVVNHSKKEFASSGTYLGDFGKVKKDILVRDLKKIKEDLISRDYQEYHCVGIE